MSKVVRLLLMEDSEPDAMLLLLALRREGYQVHERRVDSAAGMRTALAEEQWDIAISDYTMPSFSVSEGLAVLRETGIDIPFIVVSGSVGEEIAVSAMKAGAHDFFLKDRMARLGSAIERELREAEVRRERRDALARLNESEQELRQAVQARDEFLSIASHELKTPLTPLMLDLASIVRMLRRHRSAGTTAPVDGLEERLDKCSRYVERLSALVNNLLDVTRITSGRLSLSPQRVDLRQVVIGLTDLLRATIERSGSEVNVVEGSPVIGFWDLEAIDTVVSNLLTNALKYGQKKPIEIRIERVDDSARLTVVDQGIGIALAEQKRIFERFERAVSARHYGGFGIGLWVTRQVIEAHGGTIRVASKEGVGSTFVVELPIVTEVATPEGSAPKAATD